MSTLENVRVVLTRTSHPGNIGGAARAMKTMGLQRLWLVQPQAFPDPVADARASGALDILQQARVCASLDEALAGCTLAIGMTARRRDLSQPVLTPRQAAPLLLDHATASEVALVFGNETSGLSNDETDRCQRLVNIPANPEYASLNLAAAVQVMAYELRTTLSDMPAQATRHPAAADLAEVTGFFAHLEATLLRIGFYNPQQPKRLLHRLRRLFNRAGLERDEINILRGILTTVDQQIPPGEGTKTGEPRP